MEKPYPPYFFWKIPDKDRNTFDTLVDQYNKNNNKSLASTQELWDESYYFGKESANSVLTEFPEFPDGVSLEKSKAPPAYKFMVYCQKQRSNSGHERQKTVRHDFADLAETTDKKSFWVNHHLCSVLNLGEQTGWQDAWEENCKSENTNKL